MKISHSDHNADGHLRGSHDAYWAQKEQRDATARFSDDAAPRANYGVAHIGLSELQDFAHVEKPKTPIIP